MDFIETASLPIVLKSNTGASSSGVKILKDRKLAVKEVRHSFTKGILPRGFNPRDRQWGSVYLQEYIPDAYEWRMIRIGESFFGYRKEKVGDFHSGSHAWSWLEPSRKLLDMLKHVTDLGGFTSMDVDIFEAKDGQLYINELQTVFGASTPADMLRIDDKPGRMIYDTQQDKWIFEEGDFSRNACANERIRYLVSRMEMM
jgi:glutathione synthase/RimK-type ligase-like ATP-grasp enzyme